MIITSCPFQRQRRSKQVLRQKETQSERRERGNQNESEKVCVFLLDRKITEQDTQCSCFRLVTVRTVPFRVSLQFSGLMWLCTCRCHRRCRMQLRFGWPSGLDAGTAALLLHHTAAPISTPTPYIGPWHHTTPPSPLPCLVLGPYTTLQPPSPLPHLALGPYTTLHPIPTPMPCIGPLHHTASPIPTPTPYIRPWHHTTPPSPLPHLALGLYTTLQPPSPLPCLTSGPGTTLHPHPHSHALHWALTPHCSPHLHSHALHRALTPHYTPIPTAPPRLVAHWHHIALPDSHCHGTFGPHTTLHPNPHSHRTTILQCTLRKCFG